MKKSSKSAAKREPSHWVSVIDTIMIATKDGEIFQIRDSEMQAFGDYAARRLRAEALGKPLPVSRKYHARFQLLEKMTVPPQNNLAIAILSCILRWRRRVEGATVREKLMQKLVK